MANPNEINETIEEVDASSSIFGGEDAFNQDIPSDEAIMEALNAEDNTDNQETPDSDNDEPSESVEKEEAPEKDTETPENTEKESDKEEKPAEEAYEVKINGETEKVSLQDLKNGYSGAKEVARRFTELDKERKSFYSEKQEVESYISEFSSKMKNGDVVGAFSYFAQFAEVPPYMVKEQLIAALRPEIERRTQLTAEQLEGEVLKAQNEHLKTLNESETKRREKEQSHSDLQNQINSVREAHSITDDEWEAAFTALDKEVPKDQQITVDQVKDRVISDKAENTASEVLADFEGLPESAKTSLVDVILKNPDFDTSTLKEIVQESIEAAKKQEVEGELKQKLSKTSSKKAAVSSNEENNTNTKQIINGMEIEALDDWD